MTMPMRTASFVGRLGVPSVVFGVRLGILRCCALTGPLLDLLLAAGGAESAFSFSVFAASLFACAALIMAMLTLRKSRNFAFRVLVPLIAVLLVTLCTPYGADGTFRCFALFGSYFMLEACLWVMYADIAQSYRVSAFTTFGFGHGLLSAGSLAGFLMLQPGGLLEAASTEPMMLALVGLIALTLGVATLPNGAEMRSTLIRGRLCPLLDDQTDLEELMGGEVAASKPSVEEAVVPMPSDTPGAVSSAPGDIPEPATPAVQESPEQRAGRFKRKCAAVADTFLLSTRKPRCCSFWRRAAIPPPSRRLSTFPRARPTPTCVTSTASWTSTPSTSSSIWWNPWWWISARRLGRFSSWFGLCARWCGGCRAARRGGA